MCNCKQNREQRAARREADAKTQKAIAAKRVEARERRRRQLQATAK